MKKKMWISLLLVVIALIATLWVFIRYQLKPTQAGFTLVFLKDNNLLISNEDILSYNWTSQEITLTNSTSQRLIQMDENLYSFTDGFVIKINGQEIYQGVFRSPIMSAIPEPPRISIMFPSILFPSETENNNKIRMFYPGFQPPTDQSEQNSKLIHYFESVNKLTY